ncbi:efflux RND transporter permease subunit [Pseudobdellovibrio exovorus]|uniref:Efflux transporter n=1 Tax=Pseudobdellovibrio exovorus JSS TaxID=1184267 RepID=M4V9S0_9BACT|nr:efflux RND transporter permease subunit [Pseudobdellovibrio exovorus]AGH95958.1 efflux transporter [Pseudobdellovibrio exovorus JSS]
MSLANVSIKRPIFITSVIIAILAAGIAGFKAMSVDLYPDVSIPVVSVQTVYPGAGPEEIENLISRPIEDNVSTISGIKRLTSRNLEGVSMVIVEFQSTVEAKDAEQQVRDKINLTKPNLPDDIEEPVIKKFDPADSPIMMLALSAKDIGDAKLYDIADRYVKPRLEQVNNVGAIEIVGGRKREVHVILDRQKLKAREISVGQVAAQIGASGENIPSGKVNKGDQELIFRGLGEFRSVPEVADTLVNLYGNEVPTRVADLGTVVDTLEDEKTRSFFEGDKVIVLQVFRQAGSNTLSVTDDIKKQLVKIEPELSQLEGTPQLQVVIDSSRVIRNNVADVYETIIIGIILTVITVFFFLGSMRSTLITALSLPVSLIGAFALMKFAGFSINVVSLLALTLAVGLLIDDAIVVIENIYRRMELGENSLEGAEKGTSEIQMAVFAITLVVIAVFVPVAMMTGIVGQFLKQFGLTVAISMAISLFVALTIIPMLAAYFGGDGHGAHGKQHKPHGLYEKTIGRMLRGFDRFQTWLENVYENMLEWSLRHTRLTIAGTFVVFALSIYTVAHVPSEFIPDDDSGEVAVTLELAPGASLDRTAQAVDEVNTIIKKNSDVEFSLVTIGGVYGEANKADILVKLKPTRKITSLMYRDQLRQELAGFVEEYNPIVKKYDTSGGMQAQPITLNLLSPNPEALAKAADQVFERLKNDPRVKDPNTNYRTGKPEMQVRLKPGAAKEYGINTSTMGVELRAQVEGLTTAKFREMGREYDVRVRLKDDQRDLQKDFKNIYVPNINRKLVRLSDIANGEVVAGPASIERQDRSRYVQLTASVAPGVGLSEVVNDLVKSMTTGDTKLPVDVRYSFAGDAENMQELAGSAVLAIIFGTLCVYLILASLYESFITPITILVALPLALSGAFLGLFITGKTINLFAILGLFMLIGVAGKNGILLVDFTKQLMDQGIDRTTALIRAGRTRLRPILMTSFALIAGTLPIAIGLNPASRTRTSMGVAIVAGVLLSTILTLIVVPALFVYVDRFRVWANNYGARFTSHEKSGAAPTASQHQEEKEIETVQPAIVNSNASEPTEA